MPVPSKLTRDVLERILKDHRSVRAFEKMFNLLPDAESGTESTQFESALAISKGQQALDALAVKKKHGQFFDTTSQAASAVNTPDAITFNNTQIAVGVNLDGVTTSRMVVDKTGDYKLNCRIEVR